MSLVLTKCKAIASTIATHNNAIATLLWYNIVIIDSYQVMFKPSMTTYLNYHKLMISPKYKLDDYNFDIDLAIQPFLLSSWLVGVHHACTGYMHMHEHAWGISHCVCGYMHAYSYGILMVYVY